VGVAVMVGFWFYKYEVEDRDVGVVDYELLEKVDVELPTFSLCFQKPVLMDALHGIDPEVNTTTYLKYLEGKVDGDQLKHIDYFDVTLDLNKYLVAAEIFLSNESNYRKQNITTIHHKTIFNGLYYGTFTKCFAAEIKKKDLPSNILQIVYYYNQTQLLKDLRPGYKMKSNLHYPGQFLLEFGNPRTMYPPTKDKDFYIQWFISGIEYLRRRNTRNKHCMTQWKTFDDMVWKKHIRRNECRAPYDRPYDSFKKCAKKEDIEKSIFNFQVVGSKYYPKACQRISKVVVDSYSGKPLRGNVLVSYPTEVKIITQSKEIDGHSLIGNIGGYIGLFLGNH
jgi:hypothetical protein